MNHDAVQQLVREANPVRQDTPAPASFPTRSDLLDMVGERTTRMRTTKIAPSPSQTPDGPGSTRLKPALVGLVVFAVAILAVIAVATWGSDEPDTADRPGPTETTQQTTTTTTTATTIPGVEPAAGEFAAQEFAVPLRVDLTAGAGFRRQYDTEGGLDLLWAGDMNGLVFFTTLSKGDEESWRAFFGDDPDWVLLGDGTSSLGGVDAGYLDVEWAGGTTTFLLESSRLSLRYAVEPGDVLRVHVLEVGDQQMSVVVQGPADDFPRLVEDFELLAGSVEWIGSSS